MFSPLRLLNSSLLCFFLFTLFGFSLVVSAQAPQKGQGINNLAFSAMEIQRPRGHLNLFYVGSEEEGYTQICYAPKKHFTFLHFDKGLRQDDTAVISISEFPKDAQIVDFKKFGNKYYWFLGTWDRTEMVERLFVQEMDMKEYKLVGVAKEIAATSKILGVETPLGAWNALLSQVDKWKVHLSLDSSKLMVQYRKKAEVAKQNDIIGMQLFDSDFNKLWEQEVSMPYDEVNMGYEDYVIDKENNIYTLVKLYKDKVRKGSDYRMLILKWSKDKKEAQQIVIAPGTKFVNAAKLTKDREGNLIVAGCYSNIAKREGADGVFIQRLNETMGELTNIKNGVYPFPANVLREFESARALRKSDRKGDGESNSMEVRDVVMNADGSLQIYAEEYVVEYKHYPLQSCVKYQDVLVVNIGAPGDLKWVTKVPKNQYSTYNGEALSFKQVAYKGYTYMFFLDDVSNIDLDAGKAPKQYDGDKGALMVVRLDQEGKQSKAIVAKLPQYARQYYVSESIMVSPDKLLLYGSNLSQNEAAYIQFK